MSEIATSIVAAWVIWGSGVMFARWAWRLHFKADLPSEAVLDAVIGSWFTGSIWLLLHCLDSDERT